MNNLKETLPPKIFEVIERAGICTPKQLMVLSVWDIKNLTNMRSDDILFLKNVAANIICPVSITCDVLLKQTYTKVKTGCEEIDELLRGGFRRGTITEIYGESGSGKTQIVLQIAAHNLVSGCVFICTEDLFPVKRFDQIKQNIQSSSCGDNGSNVFVEHITEAQDVLSCVRVRVPKLLQKHKSCLIVIDSVAAPFRSEYSNYIQRAEDFRELAVTLIGISLEYNLAVICINQVTASFNGPDNVLPTLGLAWSNMVTTRLWLRKTDQTMHTYGRAKHGIDVSVVRELQIVFSPDLPNSSVKLIITPSGLEAVKGENTNTNRKNN